MTIKELIKKLDTGKRVSVPAAEAADLVKELTAAAEEAETQQDIFDMGIADIYIKRGRGGAGWIFWKEGQP